jgi:hypothetical protein
MNTVLFSNFLNSQPLGVSIFLLLCPFEGTSFGARTCR